jgi:AraC-like DNA-binding protein
MNAMAMAPLAHHPHLVSRDLDEVRHEGGRVFCDHDLRVVGPRQALDTRLYYRQLHHIGLGRLSYGATVDIDPGALDRFYLMQWPLKGSETIHASHAQVDSTPELGTLINPTQRFHMRHEAGAEKLFVRIEREALERLLRHWGPADAPRTELAFEPAVPLTSPALASLRTMLGWLFSEATQGDLLEQPLLAARVEEALMLAMLQLLPHNHRRVVDRPAEIAPGFVRRAEDYMAHHAAEPLTVAAIASHTGVSVRSLYAGFQRYRGRSPMEHLRRLRMDQAHAELQAPSAADTTVTEVALRWGFGHLGQFAADYRARFGELPSQTLKRARG